MNDHFKCVMDHLKKVGFLLESDPKLPSVCTLITGEPLRGSWWSHPLAQTIFQVNERLEDHADVLITKLLSRKVTFVHRKLWPEVFAIGTAREAWQIETLSIPSCTLLAMIEAAGSLTTEKFAWPKSKSSLKAKPGDAARELERKLLIHSQQFHTQSGIHAKLLETWKHWSARMGLETPSITSTQAKKKMEARVRKLNHQFNAKASLPWQTRR